MLPGKGRADLILVNALDRVHWDNAGDGRAGLRRLGDHLLDKHGIDKRPHGVMDGHQIRIRRERREGVFHRLLATVTAFDKSYSFHRVVLENQAARPVQILGAERHDNLGNGVTLQKFTDSVNQNGRAVQQHELFAAGAGFFTAHARAEPCRWQDDGDFHNGVFILTYTSGARGRRDVLPHRRTIFFVHGVRSFVEAPEDHLAGGGLQHAGDGDVDGLGDHFARDVDHHHGTVVQVGDALVILLSFLEDKDAHQFSGEYNRFQGVGQVVDIQNLHAMQLGHLVQIEVIGDDLRIVDLGQFDELHIDVPDVGKVVLEDLNVQLRHLLDALKHVQPAPAPVPFHRIRGVCHQLQLAQHKLRDHERAVHKSGFDDIGDAPVDDDAGVQNLENLLADVVVAEQAPQRRKIQGFALGRADHQATVHHPAEEDQFHERNGGGVPRHRPAEDQGNQKRAQNTQNTACGRAEQTGQAHLFDADLKKNDSQPDGPSHRGSHGPTQTEGP